MGLGFLEILGLAFALSVDAAVVAACWAVTHRSMPVGQGALLAAFFGLFQWAMPLAGSFAGEQALGVVSAFDHWVAFGLLALVAGNMLRETFFEKDPLARFERKLSASVLVMLSVATSIDALAVGFSLRMADVDVAFPAAVIGVVCALLTACAAALGKRAGERLLAFDRPLVAAGACVLVAIGLKILSEHGVF